jgi:hypothetical protein
MRNITFQADWYIIVHKNLGPSGNYRDFYKKLDTQAQEA